MHDLVPVLACDDAEQQRDALRRRVEVGLSGEGDSFLINRFLF